MNKLYKTLIYDRQVSLSVLETTELVNDAVRIHGLDESSAETGRGFADRKSGRRLGLGLRFGR